MFTPRFPGSPEKIMEAAVPFGTNKVLFDLKNFATILTDYAKAAHKAYVAAFFFRVRYSVTIPGGGAATIYNTRLQRGCISSVTINQPGMEYAAWEQAQCFSFIDNVSSNCNLPFAQLRRYLPFARGATPPAIVSPIDRTLFNPQLPGTTFDAASTWDQFDGPAVALNSGGAPVVQEIDDTYTWVPCLCSENPNNDLTPADAYANPNAPTQFNVAVGDPAASGLFGPGAANVGGSATVEVWAWIKGARAAKDNAVIGLPWAARQVPRASSPILYDPERAYRFVGLFPRYDSPTTDLGVRFYFHPYDWPSFGTGDGRWQVRSGKQWRDVFPFTISSSNGPTREHVTDLWNNVNARGWEMNVAAEGIAPMLWLPAPGSAHTILSDRVAGCSPWSSVGMNAKGFDTFAGVFSFVPAYPLGVTDFCNRGFAGFPGDNLSDCAPQILLEPDDRPSNLSTEVWANPKGRETFAKNDGGLQCGCGAEGAVQYLPAIANDRSPAASAVKDMVPWVAKGTFSSALAALTPNIPPGTLAAAVKGK